MSAGITHPFRETHAGHRPVTAIEMVVGAMVLGIVLAGLFVVYAVVYRLTTAPNMVADGVALATPVQPVASPVPQETATAWPTVAASPPVLTVAVTLPISTPTSLPATPTAMARPPATSPPTRLVIPSIDLDVPVLPVGVKTIRQNGQDRVVWADVPNAAGFHQTTAYPGNVGNTVLNGHRDMLGSVFMHLDRVQVGDEIVLHVGEMAYPYQVVETLVVAETFASESQRQENLRLIGYVPKEQLTLITCTPVGVATHRLLVIAEPAPGLVPQMPVAGSTPTP